MGSYSTTLTLHDNDDECLEVDVDLDFSIYGRYYPATRHSPEEFPEPELQGLTVTAARRFAGESNDAQEVPITEDLKKAADKHLSDNWNDVAVEIMEHAEDRAQADRDEAAIEAHERALEYWDRRGEW